MGLVPIVEGHGEVDAVPILLRRLLEQHGAHQVRVEKPIRLPRGRLVNRDHLERAIRIGCAKTDDPAILVLLDADEDCPARLGPQLLSWARDVVPSRVPVGVVVAKTEYESWFLACLDQLRGQRGIRVDAEVPPDPEAIRGAKEYLQRQMVPGWVYSETVDQPALTRLLSLELARARSPSFDKLYREVGRIAAHYRPHSQV